MWNRSIRLPRASLRVYLIALICGLIIPMFALSAVLLLKLDQQSRQSWADRLTRGAQNVAATIQGRVGNMVVTADILSSSPELATGDLRLFHSRTQSALAEDSLYLIMVDASGQQLLNTRVPYGTELGPTSNMPALERALKEDRAVISEAFFGQTSQKWVFNVMLPVRLAARPPSQALILTQNADELLPELTLNDGWQAAVIDQTGRVLDATAGLATGELTPYGERGDSGGGSGVYGDSRDGRTVMGYAKIGGTGWTALVWAPANRIGLDTSPVFSALVVGFAILMLLGIALAYLLSKEMRLAGEAIAGMAKRVGAGETVTPVTTPIAEANIVAKALADASAERKASEDHVQLILRELAHRSKNLISVVQGLISQAARQSTAPREQFLPLMERLSGLGRSIDLMTRADWAGIPLRELVERQLEPFGAVGSRFLIEGPDVTLKADAVQNLGLVLHELGTNAIKFGALSVPDGQVRMTWRIVQDEELGEALEFHWTEMNGPPAAPPEHTGFGSSILKSVAATSFGGRVDLDYSEQGFRWSLVAPLSGFAA